MANINVKVNPVTTTSVSIGSTSNKVKQVAIGQVAAEISQLRPPEPYKGKGVRYKGEQISLNENKKKEQVDV